eukprot:g17420.t1
MESEDLPESGQENSTDDVYFVSLSYKGTAYDVPVQGDDHLASIFDFVQEALDFPRENCKLISKGKMLRPDNETLTVAEAGLRAGSKVMLVASSAKDISFVQSSRADPLVKGFAEEERDEQSRRKRARAALSAWGTKQDSEFNFGSIKAEFKYSEPPPYEAERLLQRLATDPGIIEIMKTRKFKVGVLTEMSPVEAQERMAKRGTPNMDLLGYNQNFGGMIVLRLRTDTLKGFRPYHDLINTLIHELTHNVWGPHDHNFWKLFGELKAQYMKFHRFWSHGGRAADSNAGGQFQGFDGQDEAPQDGNFGQRLGGDGLGEPISVEERRAKALAAVERVEPKTTREVTPFEPSDGANAFVPNFLASNGGWMLACPCGQLHEVSEETKNQLESLFLEGFSGCLMTSPSVQETEPEHSDPDLVPEAPPSDDPKEPETATAMQLPQSDAKLEEPDAKASESTAVSEGPTSPLSSLGLLLLITASNADIQTIVTVQGFIETIFSILEDEDLTAGGKVARDLLQCLINVNGAASIVSAISSVITGKPSDEDEDDFEEYEKREGEHRWSCLSLLVDASLALVEGDQAEANRLALVKAGALELLQHLAEPMAEAPQLRLLRVFEALEPCPQAAERLQSFARRRAPLLFDLVAVLLGPVTPLTLRNALGLAPNHHRVLSCSLRALRSCPLSLYCQTFLAAVLPLLFSRSISKALQATPAGRLVVELLEAAARGGGASSDSLWFALQLLLATLVGNANVQTACVAMPVSIPSDAGPAETFQELLFRAFSAMARTVGAHANEADSDGRPNELACLVGFLKLLLYWLANCPPVLSSFATSPVMIPVAMDLTAFSGAGAFYGVQIQGLACLIMGACIMSESEAVDSMSLISQRIGIETFQHKVECLWRSEALQRPARSLGEFRWFNGHYRGFVREHQRAVQRRMVQLWGHLQPTKEACSIFDGGVGKFDIAVICHEVRSVNMQPGETICMTLADAEHRVAGEEFIALKSVGIAKSLQLDAVLVIKVWAMLDTPPLSKHAEKRALGEVRIPLKHLGDHCNRMLYQTWVNLESAGLNDSVAQLGYGGAFSNGSEALMQNIMSGPRQLYQPKACISLCQNTELAESDRIQWGPNLPRR